jgi:hypothetical protein
MAKGDHIYVQYPGLTHHGIDCGDGSVIHYEGKHKGGIICRISKNAFASGNKIKVKEYGKCYSDDLVVRRAEGRLSEKKYQIFSNNCEHFVYWCKTGKDKSEQIANVQGGVGGLVGGGTIGGGTQVATSIATQAAIKSADPISKVLINVGLKQAPAVAGNAAAGIVGVGGFASGLAANFVVGKMLEDDEALPEDERDARKNGRIAGQVASTIGGVGGGIAAVAVGGSGAVAAAVAAPAVLCIAIGFGAYHLSKASEN